MITNSALSFILVHVLHHHECVVPRQPILAHKNQITWHDSHSSASQHPSEALCRWGSEIGGRCDRGEAPVLYLGLDLPSGILWFGSCLHSLPSPHITCLDLNLSVLMALSFLIRHIKGLKMRLFSVSHTLLNRHKRVSIQTPEVCCWVMGWDLWLHINLWFTTFWKFSWKFNFSCLIV